jgi:hypothetical protein
LPTLKKDFTALFPWKKSGCSPASSRQSKMKKKSQSFLEKPGSSVHAVTEALSYALPQKEMRRHS